MAARLIACVALLAGVAAEAQAPSARPDSELLTLGQRLFEGHCARCHGLKGAGGSGPSLDHVRLRRAPDDAALSTLLRNGIPGTEMMWTGQMDEREIRQIVAYVRSLGRTEAVPLPGDAAKGRAVYEKSDCAKCHAIKRQGESVGPDLTDVGARRGAARLRQILLDPGSAKFIDRSGYLAFLIVQVATSDGRIVRGLRVNEDTFTLQIRDSDNHLHSFLKAELMELKREPNASVMPSYANVLSAPEIDDLIAFLAGLRGE
jgi:cytochrome c oxidase cbb3-type subunit III